MKSPSTIVSEISDQLRLAKITCDEFVAVNAYCFRGSSSVQLVMKGFVRVYKLFQITRKRLVVTIDTGQNAHLSFTHKGLEWVSILRAEKIDECYRLMDELQSKRIGNTLKGLPAPRVPLKRLGTEPKQSALTYDDYSQAESPS